MSPALLSVACLSTVGLATLAPMAAFADDVGAESSAAAAPSSEVVVTGRRSPQADVTGLSTTVTPTVQDTPQIVNVIPQQLIQEQRITTLEQALRDVPGITVAIGEGGTLAGDQFKIRGLDANNDIYTDGLRDFGVYTRDSFDYQEVQVLKGPSGAMFGRGSTGGAINTISKEPTPTRDFLSVDATAGTGDYWRATVDANHKINDTTAVRLNLMGNSTGVTGRNQVGSDRWGVAAAVGFGLGTPTTLVVNYLHQEDHRVPDYGLVIGAPTNVINALPVSEYGVPQRVFEQFKTDKDQTRADILSARFKWDVNPNLVFSNDLRFGSYDRYFQYTSVDSCLVNAVTKQTCVDALIDNNPNTKPLISFGGGGPYNQRAWGVQDIASVHAQFHTLGLRNEFVGGLDFNYQDSRRAFYAYTLPPLSSGVYAPGATAPARNAIVINLLTGGGNPPVGYAPFRVPITPRVAATGIPGTSVTTSAYIIDTKGDGADYAGFLTDRIWFTPQLSLIAGARYEDYEASYRNVLVSGVVQTYAPTNHLTSPRVSVVYEPDAVTTYYASYGKSSTPVGSGIVGTATPVSGANSAFDPDDGETYEVGAKIGLLKGRMSFDGAYFHVDKGNARLTDPTSGDISSQSSQKQTFEGIELGLTGKLTADWNVNLAYSYIDTTVRQDLACTTATATVAARCYPNPFTTGGPVVQVPKNSAFVWSSYSLKRLHPGLSVAGGFTYQDGFALRYTTTGTAPNLVLTRIARVPETFSLDGLVQYEARNWRAAVNFYNLTDRLNYAQSFGNRAAPGQGRTVLFTVGYSFR